jgi:uncharacterized protein with HEPN domain
MLIFWNYFAFQYFDLDSTYVWETMTRYSWNIANVGAKHQPIKHVWETIIEIIPSHNLDFFSITCTVMPLL